MSFYFLGKGPFSKSLLLRALIVQSYFPELKITGDSPCDDVQSMKKGLESIKNNTSIEGLQGGAVLRFLALRTSRIPGLFVLKGSTRLFQRPMKELESVLNQLSCEINFTENSLTLKNEGWHLSGDALTVSVNRSSQFVSAILLNSFNLNYDLFLNMEGPMVSSSYFQMTLSFLRSLGVQISGEGQEYCIPARQKINKFIYEPEPDMSCLFAIAAMTVTGGAVVFTDWPDQSLQPDFVFPDILKEMGFQVKKINNKLEIRNTQNLKPIKYNMQNCPDLFPVLSILCACIGGTSHLYGASHLVYKESDRIQETASLLEKFGRKITVLKDGLIIEGKSVSKEEKQKPVFSFDPKEDHRMAMAAGVLKKAGVFIRILNPEVVNKSFPDFWSVVNIDP